MASSICSLSPDIVGVILGYNDSSYLSLPLYLVGNASLQHLLGKSVSYIELRDYNPYSPCKVPKYLSQMRSLRHLIIDRSPEYVSYRVHDLERTVEVIRSLPEAMESIVLRFFDSSLVFDSTSSSQPTAPVSVKDTFPSLRCLRLGPRSLITTTLLSQLPSTITDLQFQLPANDNKAIGDIMTALPPSLIRLTLHQTGASQDEYRAPPFSLLSPLPPHLVYLRVHFDQGNFMPGNKYIVSAEELARIQLPPSLTSVDVGLRSPFSPFPSGHLILDMEYPPTSMPQQHFYIGWNSSCGPHIPPFMSSLCIPYITEKKPFETLAALPGHLEALGLDGIESLEPKHIRALPRRLTYLRTSASINTKNLKASDFPPTLRILSVDKFNKGMSPASAALLPPILDLSVNAHSTFDAISSLPRSITRLRLSVDELGGDVIWPPQLRMLSFSGMLLTTFGSGLDPKKAKKIKFDPKVLGTVRVVPPLASCILSTLQLATLPRTITNLKLMTFAIPTSQLVHLPPLLLQLDIDYVVPDPLYDPTNAAALSKARELQRLDPNKDDYNFDLLGAPQATIFDLLPRSLTQLSYCGTCDFPSVVWSRLPRTLETLFVAPLATIDGDFLLHIPKNRLKSLGVHHMSSLEKAHIKALPTTMRTIELELSEPPKLPASSAAYAPIALDLYGPGMGSSPFVNALNLRRSALGAAVVAGDLQTLSAPSSSD